MPQDIWEVQAPDGSTLEVQSDKQPTKDIALRAMRAYGDSTAAEAQKKAEAGSTFSSQMTVDNLLHDAKTIGQVGWNAAKSLVTEGWKNPLGINPPNIGPTQAEIREHPEKYPRIGLRDIGSGVSLPSLQALPSLPTPVSAGAAVGEEFQQLPRQIRQVVAGAPGAAQRAGQAGLGQLKTLAAPVVSAAQDPIGAAQAAGLTPDMAARAGAETAVAALTPVVLPNAGKGTIKTGQAVTNLGEWMNPTYTKRIGQGLGGLVGAELKGFGGAIGGERIGGAVGEMVPPATRVAGRLITKAGQFMGTEKPMPTGSLNTKYTPSNEQSRPLTPDEQVPPPPPDSTNVRYQPSNERSRPLTPDEQVPAPPPDSHNVRYAPSNEQSRPLTPEEQVPQAPPDSENVRYTPSNEQSRPLTPDEQVPPEGAGVRYQPSSGEARPLTPDEQVPAEGENVRYAPSDERSRPLSPEEQIAEEQSNTRYTPSDETSRPLTPEEQGPPESAAPAQGVLKTAKPEAAAEPVGNPHGELTEEELNMIRQLAAENDAIRYSGRNYNQIAVGHGGNIEVSGGAGGAESFNLVKDYGGYGSRAKMIEEAHNIIDGTGKSNANTRAIIEAARARLANPGGAGDLPPDAWKYYETPREFEARSAAGEASPAMKEAQTQQEADARPPYMRSALIEEVLKAAKEQGIEVDTEALQRGLNDPGELVSDLLNKYRQGGESTDFDPAAFEGGAPTPAAVATPAAPPVDLVLPGTEGARQVGKADVSFKAPPQASGEDFSLDSRTAAQVAADEAAAAKQAEGPSMFDEAPEGPAEGPANPQRFESEQSWKKFVKGFAKGMTDEDIRSWFKEHNYDGVSIEGKEGPKVYGLDEVGKTLPETPGAKAQTAERTPARSEKTAEEQQRDDLGARDAAAKRRRAGEKVTTEDVRGETRARMTGKLGEVSVLPRPRIQAINAKLAEMIARNATDEEFLEYHNKGREDTKPQVGILIQTALENAGRKSIVALAGAAAGGAALRQALVGQLQKKDEQ